MLQFLIDIFYRISYRFEDRKANSAICFSMQSFRVANIYFTVHRFSVHDYSSRRSEAIRDEQKLNSYPILFSSISQTCAIIETIWFEKNMNNTTRLLVKSLCCVKLLSILSKKYAEF